MTGPESGQDLRNPLGPAFRTAATIAVAMLALGPLTWQARAATNPSVEQTKAEFEWICRTLSDGDNIYFGTAQAKRLAGRLEDPVDNPLVEILLRARLATDELIRLDRHEEALVQLGIASTLAQENNLSADPEVQRKLLLGQAIAHLFLAEDLNCVERHAPGSCILPIRPEAVHTLPEHSRAAGDLFLRYLEANPNEIQSRWLLILSRMIAGQFPEGVPDRFLPPADFMESEAAFPMWQDIAPDLGIASFDLSGGAAVEDFDGDGLLDIVSSSWGPCDSMKAFRNDGKGGFEDVSHAWGLDAQYGGLNLNHADFDNDGAPDILVMRGAWLGEEGRIRNSLLHNRLGGSEARFVDVTASAGMAYPAYPTQAGAWGDYDNDGDLDLYLGNEATATSTDPLELDGKTGSIYPSQLYRNNGNRTFTDVARIAGVENRGFAKGSAWGDYDNDGDLDLYVSNIGPNRLFRNNGDGRFSDVTKQLGVIEPSGVSFATWFFDFDNDGDLDLLANDFSMSVQAVISAHLGYPITDGHPVLYRNEGGTFRDVALEVGLDRPHLVMGSNYGDLDNDGWLDIYLGTGKPDYSSLAPNAMYWNRQGKQFSDITYAGGFGHLQKGHGIAFGDLDNDGDQDLFEQMGGAFPFDAYGNVLYENPGTDNHWLVLRLVGTKANRFGVGARIEVRTRHRKQRRSIHLVAGTGGSFGSSSLQQEIGLGKAALVESIVIVWPGSGTRQEFVDVRPDRFYEVIEGDAELRLLEPAQLELGGTGAKEAHSEH